MAPPGLYGGPAEMFPRREQRYAVAVRRTAGGLDSPFFLRSPCSPEKRIQDAGTPSGATKPGCGQGRSSGSTAWGSRKAVRTTTGEETEPPVPDSAEFGIKL